MRGKLLGRLARWGWRSGERSDKRRIRSIEINLWKEDVGEELHPDLDREWGEARECRQQRLQEENLLEEALERGKPCKTCTSYPCTCQSGAYGW